MTQSTYPLSVSATVTTAGVRPAPLCSSWSVRPLIWSPLHVSLNQRARKRCRLRGRARTPICSVPLGDPLGRLLSRGLRRLIILLDSIDRRRGGRDSFVRDAERVWLMRCIRCRSLGCRCWMCTLGLSIETILRENIWSLKDTFGGIGGWSGLRNLQGWGKIGWRSIRATLSTRLWRDLWLDFLRLKIDRDQESSIFFLSQIDVSGCLWN